jgi:hypothetical protein
MRYCVRSTRRAPLHDPGHSNFYATHRKWAYRPQQQVCEPTPYPKLDTALTIGLYVTKSGFNAGTGNGRSLSLLKVMPERAPHSKLNAAQDEANHQKIPSNNSSKHYPTILCQLPQHRGRRVVGAPAGLHPPRSAPRPQHTFMVNWACNTRGMCVRS